jgi:hypothetical protein
VASDLLAVQLRGTLVVSASVVVSGCEGATIEPTLLPVEPPSFNVFVQDLRKPGEICDDMVRSVPVRSKPRYFGRALEEVVVRDASGDRPVPVKQVRGLVAPAALQGGGGGQPDPLFSGLTPQSAKAAGLRTAVGYSNAYSLGEAIRDAIANLPLGQPPVVADQLNSFQVLEIGAEIGGIAGVDHLRVVIAAF